MSDRVHHPLGLQYSAGTQVVTLVEILGQSGKILQPRGSVGVVTHSPATSDEPYRVRFPDGTEELILREKVVMLARFKESEFGDDATIAVRCNLYDRVMYRCVIGSQAYGLAGEGSDIDRRGFFLPPAELHWSLYGVPDQLENEATQEAYWEVQKFIVLALKANPNVLECLYSPIVEHVTPLAERLLAIRECFLSRLVYQTYNGYVLSQFKKMQAEIRNRGQLKWKHVMHLVRLMLSGIKILREGIVPVRVEEHREKLLAIRRGEMPWEEVEAWRQQLHQEFNLAADSTRLPERPNYEQANLFLIEARRAALKDDHHAG